MTNFYTITVLKENTEQTIQAESDKSLLDSFRAAGIFTDAPCGGKGRCRKCLVQIIQGEYLPDKRLPEGFCLACRLFPKSHMVLRIPTGGEAFQIVSAHSRPGNPLQENMPAQLPLKEDQGLWGIAVDIGTTTIAMQGIDLESGQALGVWSGINHQIIFGADVLSRIDAALDGNAFTLKDLIQQDLALGIRSLLERIPAPRRLKRVCIAGNTAMLHLLCGYDCRGLGSAPFAPVTLKAEQYDLQGLVGNGLPGVPVVLMPGISAFIGADIVSGVCHCGLDTSDEISLFIDIGTNAEMVLGNKHGLLCASAAAGPAFEGGNITHGMGSLPGAIQRVSIQNEKIELSTIGDRDPRGICGTGVLDAAAELYRAGLMDETGLLCDDLFETGFVLGEGREGKKIVLSQKDIRELQLAKAAVRAGIETLLHTAGIGAGEVTAVYAAGGFGFYMDMEKAITLGLFPEAFAGKIRTVGNSSLAGCTNCLLHPESLEGFTGLSEKCICIDLSESDFFRNIFIGEMDFPPLH